MSKQVEVLIKVKDADEKEIIDFVRNRFTDIFSKVKETKLGENRTSYKGGSLLRPYGVKATVTKEKAGNNATILKFSGRPKMNLIAYLALILVFVLLLVGLSYPAEAGLGLIAAFIMIVAALFEQKKVMKNIKQVADDTQNRFL